MTLDKKPTEKKRGPKKGTGGRPKSDNPRTTYISVRVTPEEKAAIQAMAGDGSAGEMLRSMALGRKAKLPRAVPELNREAWAELSRTASNLNQLAHHANATGEIQSALDDAIHETRRQLADVRGLLMGRLPEEDDDDGSR
jgi:hypothetical protein